VGDDEGLEAMSTELSYHFADGKRAVAQLPPKRPPMKIKSWGLGSLVGASLLVIGTTMLAKAFSAHTQSEAERFMGAQRFPRENARGEYGKRS
jgi:hypothetical protein